MNRVILTDGSNIKTINPFTDETPGAWTTTGKAAEVAKSTRLVPSVFAGIQSRIQAIADLPFTIYSVNGDTELDNSDNYKNVIGILPYPSRTFSLSEGALVVAGKSYWFKGTGARTGQVKELKYWIPSSVTLDPDKAKLGIIEFKRQGVTQSFPAEQVLYMWGIDPEVELGPPTVWPLESALIAAQANGAVTAWVADYMKRGAVKAMLLMVDGMPPAGEVEKMETWFNRLMSGTRSIVWKVFNAAGVKPVVVGDGLDSVQDLSMSKDLRYEIHQALGTRHLLEDENLATANARERQFYTITIMPDARVIQYAFNEQILHAMGYHLEFEPQRLEIFQEDEGLQAQSFGYLFNLFREVMSIEAAFELAAQKLDYQFTEDQQALILKGIADKQSQPPIEVIPPATDETIPPEVVKALVELDKWQDKVNKAGKMVTWHAVSLLPDMVKNIKDGTLTFEQARAMITEPKQEDTELKALADAINKAAAVVNG